MGLVTSCPEMLRNYLDLLRKEKLIEAWLIERTTVLIPDTAHSVTWWDGLGWTFDKNDAVRFLRWADAAIVIDHVLPPRTMDNYYSPMFHDDLRPF